MAWTGPVEPALGQDPASAPASPSAFETQRIREEARRAIDAIQNTAPDTEPTPGSQTAPPRPPATAPSIDAEVDRSRVGRLQASLSSDSDELLPNTPVTVRFTLSNPTAEPISIPLDPPIESADGYALPVPLLFGSPTRPTLTVQLEGEVPQRVLPPALPGSAGQVHELTLAPRGMIGTELDLREYCRDLRYPGAYTVVWRPFGRDGPLARLLLRIESTKDAVIVTDHGKITIRLSGETAPQNVKNFLELVRSGFYRNLTLHRVVPEFVVSGGCPNGDGSGARKDGRTVAAELTDAPFDVGTVAMAHLPNQPDSASCQFFMCLGRYPELDRHYTIIGRATDPASLATLRAISDAPIDRDYRPLRTIFIRSINLVDSDRISALDDDTQRVQLPPSRRKSLSPDSLSSLEPPREAARYEDTEPFRGPVGIETDAPEMRPSRVSRQSEPRSLQRPIPSGSRQSTPQAPVHPPMSAYADRAPSQATGNARTAAPSAPAAPSFSRPISAPPPVSSMTPLNPAAARPAGSSASGATQGQAGGRSGQGATSRPSSTQPQRSSSPVGTMTPVPPR